MTDIALAGCSALFASEVPQPCGHHTHHAYLQTMKHPASLIARCHERSNSAASETTVSVPADASLGPSVSDLESCGPLRRSVSGRVLMLGWALPYLTVFLQRTPGVLSRPACTLATFQTAAVALAGPNDGNR